DLLDHLRKLSRELDCTVGQLVIAWTLRQTGITCALIGAKRPDQITETAQAMELELSPDTIAKIDSWIAMCLH
nr:aldo/keto reductase [Anaerolineae bacterium]